MSMILVAALGSLFAAITVGVLALSTARQPRGVATALAALDANYAADASLAAPADAPLSERISTLTSRFARLGRALTPMGALARLENRLEQAGSPAAWPAERIVQARGALLIALGLWGGLLGVRFGGLGGFVLAAVAGGAFGAYLPILLAYNTAVRRQQKIRSALPDILDVLTICVEAGLGFDAALAQVAMNGKGPLQAEIGRVLQEMQIGKSRAEALRSMAARTSVVELRTFVSSIVQATELGIPIASVLREQAKEMRILRRQRAEEAAHKVPIKILFPLVFFLFPALFIVVIGPGALRIVAVFSN
ncbi:MAG: type secretion system protein [Actinomycetia bacterium]|jgi:tight adherence protein C|nr:type secretion system protein [Actinomycetes bacterium]